MPKPSLSAIAIYLADLAVQQGVVLPRELNQQLTRAAKDEAYYEEGLFNAVQRRYNEEIDDSEFLALFALLISQQLRRAYLEGLAEAGMDDLDASMESELFMMQMEEEAHSRSLLNDIKIAILTGAGHLIFQWRMSLWANRYLDVRNRGVVRGGIKQSLNLRWDFGATEKHCSDCAGYAGQIKTALEWDDIFRIYGHKPQARELACKGYNCDCRMTPTND